MKTAVHKIFLLLLLTLVSTIAFAAAEEDKTSNASTDVNYIYKVQPGDIISISVWKEEDLQREVLIRPDSGFSFPLIGEINSKGKSVAKIKEEIAAKLEKFIPQPDVSVSIRQINGNKIYVIGKVNRPGEFSLSKPLDVMQALSLAGGTATFAELDDIIILRREKGTQHAIPFNYPEVERGKKLEQNIILQSGDVVVVP
ncbi:MAG: polysaccharide export protein [Gammaproteobacteria bacterium]|nr:MAG: polysaccharide export protein [Gammaproteobacteria bacterium]